MPKAAGPIDLAGLDLVEYSLRAGEAVLSCKPREQVKKLGQFLTPPDVARFMARQLWPLPEGCRVLDPAVGSAILLCAVIEQIVADASLREIWLDGFEIDPALCEAARAVLHVAAEHAAQRGIRVHTSIQEGDFVEYATALQQPTLFTPGSSLTPTYHRVIANPPYFKVKQDDPSIETAAGPIAGSTNIYTIMMALAADQLTPDGRACFIVPRSFCSGAYFGRFRAHFIERFAPFHVHLFASREDVFQDNVLQENVIWAFRRRYAGETLQHVEISASKSAIDLDTTRPRRVAAEYWLRRRNGELFFGLPVTELDEEIVALMDRWTGSFAAYDLNVSTGPVVDFRARDLLLGEDAVVQQKAVPLLWMHNVKPGQTAWPLPCNGKAASIGLQAEKLLLPMRNYVLVRRFSAKEELRRLIAAPLLKGQFPYAYVGLENHLNYIVRPKGEMTAEEATGLSALLNSALVDRYFRIVNGSTQVNAAELRALPLPTHETLTRIGEIILGMNGTASAENGNAVVFNELRKSEQLPIEFPTFEETRYVMGKIQEAQTILADLGMPSAQQNEMSALTLLVLAQLSEETPWEEAAATSLRIHDILVEIKARFGREYAENTRETIRRQVIHQLLQAGIVERNADEPGLPTNSPRTRYRLVSEAISLLRAFGALTWPEALETFREKKGALLEIYQRQREQY